MSLLANVKGLLLDLDGVLYVGSQPIAGAAQAVARIRKHIRCRFITNTSTRSLHSVHQKLTQLGFSIGIEEIISALQVAKILLKNMADELGRPPACWLLLHSDVQEDFSQFSCATNKPDVILIGDIGEAWDYALMNRIFERVMAGAQLMAIHKNRFWEAGSGLKMDIGGFVAALEYAGNTSARIVGKPSVDFFQVALDSLGLPATQVAIVGDDIESDIGGGQAAGLAGILVKTGKYRAEYVSSVVADCTLDSICDLPDMLGC